MKRKLFCVVTVLCMLCSMSPAMAFGVTVSPFSAEAVSDDNGSGEDLPDVNETGNELSENDQLLSMYMDKTLNDRLGNQAQLFADSRDFKPPMSEATEKVYKDLKKQVQDIAKGNNTSRECSWTVPVHLGITINAEAATQEAAVKEARAQFDKEVDLNAVVDALLVNCPYDLFWYDKKAGYHSECSYSITRVSEDGPFTAAPDQLSFSFSVAKEYTQEDGTSIDTNKICDIQNSLEKISGIVFAASNEPDIEKLRMYKQNICDLTSYNFEAANDESTPYGNPWQLIWVFDENPETNVVCEGYSKAFQYLCDLSDFDSYIYCYSVSGTMTGGTGEGPHMWNIVHMGNGLNYLADITNCDEGTIGEGDELFLKGSENGSPQTGYTFELSGGWISYVYDEDTKNIYTKDDLTLSSEDDLDGDYQNQTNRIAGHSLLLASEIGVCFRVSFSNGYNPSNCVMNFKLSDGRKESVPIAEADKIPVNEERSDYRFTCYINPLELADTITATVSDGDTTILTDRYSAMNYIEYIQGSWETMGEKGERIRVLVNALQDYGHYMQKSGWTDGKDSHAQIFVSEYALNIHNVEDAWTAVTDMQIKKNLDDTGIDRVKFALNLNESTIVRIYVKPEDGSSISSASVTSADGSDTSLNCNEKKEIDGKVYYQFATGKIGAANLGKDYTFKVTTEKGDAEVTVSALSYVYAVLDRSNGFTDAKQYAMTAYYYYYNAAKNYVDNVTDESHANS